MSNNESMRAFLALRNDVLGSLGVPKTATVDAKGRLINVLNFNSPNSFIDVEILQEKADPEICKLVSAFDVIFASINNREAPNGKHQCA